jgi:hypothetical protein
MMPLLERHFHMTLIELVAFQIAVVVPCHKAHLIGLTTLNQGGGTDSSNVFVSEGDDALSGAAGKVGRGAVVVEVVLGPAEAAGPRVGTFVAIMARILAMA